MKISVCYVAVSHGPITSEYAARFVSSYHEFPPGAKHETVIICNGGPLPHSVGLIFAPLNPLFYPRPNDGGWDISGYIDAAKGPCADSDMMMCLGESVWFHRAGWINRMVNAWNQVGPGLYGSFSSNLVRPHLNTTGFICPPCVLRDYPRPVRNKTDRYEFEHGTKPFWKYVAGRGMPVRLITWDGIYEPRAWRVPVNILWRGDQSNCLMFCSHTERWAKANAETKAKWSRGADRPFR